jgi:hypothetical protein
MFVRRSSYMEMAVIAETWRLETMKWIQRAKNAEARANAAERRATREPVQEPLQLTQEDIKRMLMLCHPDKHDGKQAAVEMTQKLLAMRRK